MQKWKKVYIFTWRTFGVKERKRDNYNNQRDRHHSLHARKSRGIGLPLVFLSRNNLRQPCIYHGTYTPLTMLATKVARRAILISSSLAAPLPHSIFHRKKTIIRDQHLLFFFLGLRSRHYDYLLAHLRLNQHDLLFLRNFLAQRACLYSSQIYNSYY